MAEMFPADGDLDGAVTSGELSEEDAHGFLSAAGAVTGYGDENCA